MGIFLPHNINYKEKPQQYGDFSFVQSSLFENADRIGIEPDKIVLAMPMWNAGNQQDYSKNGIVGINNGANYDKNNLKFNGLSHISTNVICSTENFSIIFEAKANKILEGCVFGDNDISFPYKKIAIVFGETSGEKFYVWLGDGTSWASASIYDFQWRNFTTRAVTRYQKDSIKMYVNGEAKPVMGNSPYVSNFNLEIVPRGYRSLNGALNFLSFSTEVWSEDQIAFLSDNPYYLWQPRNKRTWFIPVDATGGNIFQVSCSDGFSFNDASTRTAVFSVMANETLSLSDAPDNVGNFLSSALSQILMTDQTSTRLITLGNVTDSISISDTASVLSSITGLVSDSVTLSDQSFSTGIFQGNATDSFSFADAVVNSLLLQGVVNEILTLSDSASLGNFLQGIVSDSISFSDSVVNTATLIAAIQENLTLSDSAVNILNTFASASDTINLSDMSAWGAFKQALAVSGFNLTDSAANNLLTFAQAADSITFEDNAHMNVTFNVEVKDAVSFAETVSKIAIFQAAVSDSVNLSATAMEVSQLPNGKVSVSFNMKVPGVGINIKTATITFNLK